MKNQRFALVISAILFAVLPSLVEGINNRPIIGILAQPGNGGYGSETVRSLIAKNDTTQYIAASYVKFIESGGARVVPILYNQTQEELETIFKSINGLLYPGGGADLDGTPFYKTSKILFDLAVAANDRGDFFPVTGHCMGFEILALIASEDPHILSPIDAENVSMPLNLTAAAFNSRYLRNMPKEMLKNLATLPLTLNNHQWGVTPSDHQQNSKLRNFFQILSTNVDRKGREFISTWEGVKYPFYGIQWHAEKPLFEWNAQEDINHSIEAVEAMHYFSNFFVNAARQNDHKFSSFDEEYKSLIYNYAPVYSYTRDPDFEQLYIF